MATMAMATEEEKKEMGFAEKDENSEEEEEEEEDEEEEEEEEEEKWIMHYSSNHQILLVGEGDFSFSFALALAFGSASNICASSLDSLDTVKKKYKKAPSNLDTLQKLGASILDGVDAVKMKHCPELSERKFDRIIYNFPHAGFHGKEDNRQLIRKHKSLVEGFFRNASGMLRPNGEVHVTHKTTAPFCNWNIEELARKNSLSLIYRVKFKKEDYPGYNHKRGAGSKCDEPFPLGECSTFIFGFFRAHKKSRVMSYDGFTNGRPQLVQEIPFQLQKHEIPFGLRYPHAKSTTGMDEFPAYVKFDGSTVRYSVHVSPRFDSFIHPQTGFTRNTTDLPGYKRPPLISGIPRENAMFHNGCFNSSNKRLGRFGMDVGYLSRESLIPCETYISEAPGFQTENAWNYDGCFNNANKTGRRINCDVGYHFLGTPSLERNITEETIFRRENARIYDGSFSNVNDTLRRIGDDAGYAVHESLYPSSRYVAESSGRTLNGYLHALNERCRQSNLRSALLPRKRLDVSYNCDVGYHFLGSPSLERYITEETIFRRENARIYDGSLSNVNDSLRRIGDDAGYAVHESLYPSSRYVAESSGRTLNGYLQALNERCRQRNLR